MNFRKSLCPPTLVPFHMETQTQYHCLFVLSDELSVSRWYAVDILCFIPANFIRAFQNFDTKNLSQSLINSNGHPFSQYHLSKNKFMKSSAVMSVLHSMICMSAPSLSVIVTMASYPLSVGKGQIKSIATESNHLSRIGSGCNGPGAFVMLLLFCWHALHPGMYTFIKSLRMFGQ